MELQDDFLSIEKSQYGENFNQHILEIYKVYLEMTDRISARRQSANSYFLSLNTAVAAFMGYAQSVNSFSTGFSDFIWIFGVAGMILCYTWYRLIRSYRDLNSGKFKVVHEIEKLLPISPYDAEWSALGRGKDPNLYLQFTKIELRVPWIFFTIHTTFALYIIYKQFA